MKNQSTTIAEPSSAAARSGTHPRHRILVVDDDTAILRLSAEVLTRSGYGVDAAADGEAAWKALTTNSYDLLITDNNMPKISGVELVRKLRAAHMALPVIMATGGLPKEELAQAAWPATMLLKPYAVTELLGLVREVLRANDSAKSRTARMGDLCCEASDEYAETNPARRVAE